MVFRVDVSVLCTQENVRARATENVGYFKVNRGIISLKADIFIPRYHISSPLTSNHFEPHSNNIVLY